MRWGRQAWARAGGEWSGHTSLQAGWGATPQAGSAWRPPRGHASMPPRRAPCSRAQRPLNALCSDPPPTRGRWCLWGRGGCVRGGSGGCCMQSAAAASTPAFTSVAASSSSGMYSPGLMGEGDEKRGARCRSGQARADAAAAQVASAAAVLAAAGAPRAPGTLPSGLIRGTAAAGFEVAAALTLPSRRLCVGRLHRRQRRQHVVWRRRLGALRKGRDKFCRRRSEACRSAELWSLPIDCLLCAVAKSAQVQTQKPPPHRPPHSTPHGCVPTQPSATWGAAGGRREPARESRLGHRAH